MYAVSAMTAESGVRPAHPLLPLPQPFRGAMGIVLFGALFLNRYEIGGWVFEKNRLLQALKFDKRWLKYTVRMEDILMIIEYV
jgi:hypothetical protein